MRFGYRDRGRDPLLQVLTTSLVYKQAGDCSLCDLPLQLFLPLQERISSAILFLLFFQPGNQLFQLLQLFAGACQYL